MKEFEAKDYKVFDLFNNLYGIIPTPIVTNYNLINLHCLIKNRAKLFFDIFGTIVCA